MFVRMLCLAAVVCTGLCAQNSRFAITMKSTPNLKDHPVMLSVIGNGSVVNQTEVFLADNQTWAAVEDLPPGTYDVRVAGEGVVTEVKRGVQLFVGKGQSELAFVLRAGTGIHTVEYATGGLAREEVAARLHKLDTEVAELQKKVAAK